MDAGFLDVLHNAPDHHPLSVSHGINIQLVGVFEIVVDQMGCSGEACTASRVYSSSDASS